VNGPVLYLGDDTLKGAAGYLGGVMNASGLAFNHVESGERVGEKRLAAPHAAVIISDFPAANFTAGAMERIAEDVNHGCGLLMIGGWSSFHGLNGLYDASPLASVLPVEMEHGDDRINWSYPCMMSKNQQHEILAGLPFDVPPTIGGLNRVRPKRDTQTLLSAMFFKPRKAGGLWAVQLTDTHPLLCIGFHGEGRTACYMSDFAPHWCGGSVDWGAPRVTCHVGAATVEVGSLYARLVAQLVRWVAGGGSKG
jgi:hypothetical protein